MLAWGSAGAGRGLRGRRGLREGGSGFVRIDGVSGDGVVAYFTHRRKSTAYWFRACDLNQLGLFAGCLQAIYLNKPMMKYNVWLN